MIVVSGKLTDIYRIFVNKQVYLNYHIQYLVGVFLTAFHNGSVHISDVVSNQKE